MSKLLNLTHTTSSFSRTGAFTKLGGALIAVVMLALAAIAIPHFVRAPRATSMDTCLYTRMWIESAKAQWAMENNKTASDTPTELRILEYMGKVTPMWDGRKSRRTRISARLPRCCTSTNIYVVGAVGERVRCTSDLDHDWNEQSYRYHYALD